eukprot:TRINITY_DN69366_c0_g1_i1.p1 TRINITY_DN69366_c0_g1~~TRINITY_DN69366_c0_g1_i1.p1  ORF type:complete len:384 (+),score=45.52 TRINITY_DN69366_c0_g1_i1:96-1247(+)
MWILEEPPVGWSDLEDEAFFGESVEAIDPVFKGMVREFCLFNETMQCLDTELRSFMDGFESLTHGLCTLTDSITDDMARQRGAYFRSDSLRMREASRMIAEKDSSQSALGKLRANCEFNLVSPIKLHLENNTTLKTELSKRRRRFYEFEKAKEQFDTCVQMGLPDTDQRSVMSQTELDLARKCYCDADRRIFEWLYALEEHKGDMLDSFLQTLKHLQYDFFAMSAHAVSRSLPDRMDFRALVKMTPECLEAELQQRSHQRDPESLCSGNPCTTTVCSENSTCGFTSRLIDRYALDDKDGGHATCNVAVCPLSLSSLLSQGCEEARARRALRLHNNDTQAALDWLLEPEPAAPHSREPTGRRLGSSSSLGSSSTLKTSERQGSQ